MVTRGQQLNSRFALVITVAERYPTPRSAAPSELLSVPTPRSAAPSQDAGRVLNFACSPRQRTEARSRLLVELSYNLSILKRPTSSSATGRATPNASPPNALRSPSCSSSFANAGAPPRQQPIEHHPDSRLEAVPDRADAAIQKVVELLIPMTLVSYPNLLIRFYEQKSRCRLKK